VYVIGTGVTSKVVLYAFSGSIRVNDGRECRAVDVAIASGLHNATPEFGVC
jgi:hypothetical protein